MVSLLIFRIVTPKNCLNYQKNHGCPVASETRSMQNRPAKILRNRLFINGESNSRLGTAEKRRQKETTLCLERKLAIQLFRTLRQLQRADRPTGAFSV